MSKNRIAIDLRGWGIARLGAAAVVFVLALGAGGCGRNGGGVPASFVPEGVGGKDNLLLVELDTTSATPAVVVTVAGRTSASGYRVYRRLEEGGFDTAVDYVTPFGGTLNQGYGVYSAEDRDWQPGRAQRYLGRGLVGGTESSASPLTNEAVIPAGEAAALAPAGFGHICPVDTMKTDSLPVFVWQPVPDAVRYVVWVMRSDGRPFFIGLTEPAAAPGLTNYRLGSGTGTVIHEALLTKSLFYWRADAVNAEWRVIARTGWQIFTVKPILEAKPPCLP